MIASTHEIPQIIPPSPWVVRHAGLLPRSGEILDLACGSGRHARWLAGQGYRVAAVDRDLTAISSLQGVPGVRAWTADLEGETWPLAGQSYAGIVVTNYLWRPRWSDLLALLAPGGVLIYETFMLGNAAYGKPSRPEFLLQPGELRQLAIAGGLHEVAFVEGLVEQPKPAMRQAICALRD